MSCSAVDITYFNVPKFVNRKDDVTLECNFVMSESLETLHSVKWYRIDHQGHMEDFFTYDPNKKPPVKTYHRSGIKVNVSQTNRHYYHIFKTDSIFLEYSKYKGNDFCKNT